MTHPTNGRPPRTLLEQLIRERTQTLEEFTESAETYAREHGEAGTLSLRHLQRLITGKRPDGRSPSGTLRPATARLLEHILGEPIDRLLSEPFAEPDTDEQVTELRARIASARQIDSSLIGLLHAQLNVIRRIDRQLGAVIAHEEVKTKIGQVEHLLTYSLTPAVRQGLARLLSELGTLAGWQALDLGYFTDASRHYAIARAAAAESGSFMHQTHAAAEQGFLLVDLGEQKTAAELTSWARTEARRTSPVLLRTWLEAAYGETLAALGDRDESLKCFDNANNLFSDESFDGADQGPYVALDAVHLARWQGHALALLSLPAALSMLHDAELKLDSSYCRAAVALQVDLATAYIQLGDMTVARAYLQDSTIAAHSIQSIRQLRRINHLRQAAGLVNAPA